MVSAAVQRAAILGIIVGVVLFVLGQFVSLGTIGGYLMWAVALVCGFLAVTWDKKDLVGGAIAGAITGGLIGVILWLLVIVYILIRTGVFAFAAGDFLINALLINAALGAVGGVVATFVNK